MHACMFEYYQTKITGKRGTVVRGSTHKVLFKA
jgi:hypothetical protein